MINHGPDVVYSLAWEWGGELWLGVGVGKNSPTTGFATPYNIYHWLSPASH